MLKSEKSSQERGLTGTNEVGGSSTDLKEGVAPPADLVAEARVFQVAREVVSL